MTPVTWPHGLLAAILLVALPGAAGADSNSQLRIALAAQDAWLGDNEKADIWRRFLRNELLKAQLELGAEADPEQLSKVLSRYNAEQPGIDAPRFRKVRNAVRSWRLELIAHRGGLSNLARASRGEFQPVNAEQLESARQSLAAAAYDLERSLVPGSSQGEAWKDYLLWSTVQKQLVEGAPLDLQALQATYDRLTSGHEGLDRDEFQNAAAATKRLIDRAIVSRAKDQGGYYNRQLEILADLLDRDPEALDPRVSRQIELRLELLAGLGQSPELLADLRRKIIQPNLHAIASERLLGLLAQRVVMETRPLRDTILDTRICGSGSTRGDISLQLVPSVGAARLAFQLTGATASQTVGYNGPVAIRSVGDTRFHGAKIVEITDEAFTVLPSSVGAKTKSRTTSITKQGGPIGKRLIESIAHKRVRESRGKANAIASRKAEGQIASEFDQQVTEEVRAARRSYDDLVRRPLRGRGAPPQQVVLATSRQELFVSALQATARQLGAPDAPPEAPSGDLSLRVHQSALNNLADAFLGGATIRRRAADLPTEIDAVLPAKLREELSKQPPAEPGGEGLFKPWELELRRERPLSFAFKDGAIQLLVHTARIKSGEDEFRNWDLLVTYEAVQENGEWFAQLVGEIEVLPTSFDPGVPGARLNSRQRALRRNLAKQFTARANDDPNFPSRPKIKPIDLARLKKPGLNALELQVVRSDAGWLTLSFSAR